MNRSTNLNVQFPSVLPDMDYDDRIPQSNRRAVTLSLPEAQELCSRYLNEMYNGVLYDRWVREEWNTSSPNEFRSKNIEATNKMGGRLSYNGSKVMLDEEIPALKKIPLAADLFETEKFDGIAGDILMYLDGFTGVDVAVASKLLYQKRPGLVPIFDSLTRRAMGIAWSRGEAPADYLLLFTWHR
jgi:hypothetical protein